MKLALIHDGLVQAEADAAALALPPRPDGKSIFDIRDVSAVAGIAPGWLANADGTFSAPAATALDLSAYAKARRDLTEAQGITVNGVAVASDPDSQTRVANAYSGMQVTGATSIRFKATSGFIVLTLDQVKAVGSALFAHTQACFDAEDQIDAGLAASPPTITTLAEVDAVFAAVKSAY